jgi:hypothetical protein
VRAEIAAGQAGRSFDAGLLPSIVIEIVEAGAVFAHAEAVLELCVLSLTLPGCPPG